MPLYDYRCTYCGPFEAVRRIAERDGSLACPQCGVLAPRQVNTKAASVGGSGAETTGDGDTGRYGGMRHRGGCLCCR